MEKPYENHRDPWTEGQPWRLDNFGYDPRVQISSSVPCRHSGSCPCRWSSKQIAASPSHRPRQPDHIRDYSGLDCVQNLATIDHPRARPFLCPQWESRDLEWFFRVGSFVWISSTIPPKRATDVTKNQILQVAGCVFFNWCLQNRAVEKSQGITTKKIERSWTISENVLQVYDI